MNVAREDGAKRGRNVAMTNDVRGGREGEVRRSDRRAFDAMVHAEQTRHCIVLFPPSLAEQTGQTPADIVALIRKTGETDSMSANLEDERSRAIEHAQVRMESKTGVRDSRPLVVAGHDENRYAPLGDASKRFECLIGGAGHRSRAVEDVASVDDDVHFAAHRRLERRMVVREKVVAATVPIDARPLR